VRRCAHPADPPAAIRRASLTAEARGFALDLRRAGLLLDTVAVDAGNLQARLDRGDFDLATLTWDGRRDEDPRLLSPVRGNSTSSAIAPSICSPCSNKCVWRQGLARACRHCSVLVSGWPANGRSYSLPSRRLCTRGKTVHGLAGVGDRLDLRSVWAIRDRACERLFFLAACPVAAPNANGPGQTRVAYLPPQEAMDLNREGKGSVPHGSFRRGPREVRAGQKKWP